MQNMIENMKIKKQNGTELEVELEVVYLEREASYDQNFGIVARSHGREIGSVTSMTGPDWDTYLDGMSVDEEFRDTDLGVCMLRHLYENQSTIFTDDATVTVHALSVDIREPSEYVKHILVDAEAAGVFTDRTTPHTPQTRPIRRNDSFVD